MSGFKMTYLKQRGGQFIFRRAVPPDVRGVIGKREWKVSLGSNAAQAKRRALEEAAKTDGVIANARQEHEASAPASERDYEEFKRIAQLVYQERLHDYENELRLNPKREAEVWEAGLDAELEEWADGLRAGAWSKKVDGIVAHTLETYGMFPPVNSLAFDSGRQLIARAYAVANRMAAALYCDGPMPRDPLFSGPAASAAVAESTNGNAATVTGVTGDTISQVLTRWLGERKPPAKTRAEWDRAVRRWKELHGDTPVAAITRAQVSDFKDALLRCPARPSHKLRDLDLKALAQAGDDHPELSKVSGTAVNKTLAAIRSILSYAKINGVFSGENPASGVRAIVQRKAEDEERRPFAPTELQKVLAGSLKERRKADRWLPVLAAFMGARESEMALANAADVKQEDGITYLRITDAGEGRSLKNKGSRRNVPVHPVLVKLGFLEYVASIKSGPLFPDLTSASAYSKRFARFLDKLGLNDPALTFHSFRHGFKDECRRAGITEEHHDALTGHAGNGSVGRTYGRGVPLSVLAEAVARIKYPGLNLSKLKP